MILLKNHVKIIRFRKTKSDLNLDEKLKHVLADFQNLNRKTQSDIETWC